MPDLWKRLVGERSQEEEYPLRGRDHRLQPGEEEGVGVDEDGRGEDGEDEGQPHVRAERAGYRHPLG